MPAFLHIPVHETIGLTGAAVYAVSYILVAFDRMPSQSAIYYLARLVAASLVSVSLVGAFHLVTAVIQGFFILVSVIGLIRHMGARREARAHIRSQVVMNLTDRLAAAREEDACPTRRRGICLRRRPSGPKRPLEGG